MIGEHPQLYGFPELHICTSDSLEDLMVGGPPRFFDRPASSGYCTRTSRRAKPAHHHHGDRLVS